MSDEAKEGFGKIEDGRILRPFLIAAKKQNIVVSLGHNEIYSLNGTKVIFTTPNNISICFSIAEKNYELAKELFVKFIKPKLASSNVEVKFDGKESSKLFDYFEHLQISLIFVYTAVEAFANIAIPENFSYEKKNNKGVKEVWGKESIERWLSTTEKISEIIPSILKIASPKEQKFWSNFKKLEEIRNEIIHQKTVNNETNVSSKYLKEFFNEAIFNIIRSGFIVVEYFCSNTEFAHIYFPLGVGTNKTKPLVIEDWDTHFKTVSE